MFMFRMFNKEFPQHDWFSLANDAWVKENYGAFGDYVDKDARRILFETRDEIATKWGDS